MKLYENIVVGNFLYALGYAVAKKVAPGGLLPVVNLLQQTPDDKRLADLFMCSQRALRIIEFKREENTDGKEELKLASLRRCVRTKQRIRMVSKKIHWFVESSVPGTELSTRIVPYLDAYPPGPTQFDFLGFAEETAQALTSGVPGVSDDEMKNYLDILALCNGGKATGGKANKPTAASGSGKTRPILPQSSSLILQLSDDGGLQYAHVVSYKELSETRKEIFIRYQRETAIEVAMSMDSTLEQNHNAERQSSPEKSPSARDREHPEHELTL